MKLRFILILTLVLQITAVYAQINISNKLVASWPLDSNLTDVTGNSPNGTRVNNPIFTTDRFGQIEKALKFNGNNQFAKFGDILDTVFCDSPNAIFTVSGWFKPDTIPSSRSVVIGKAAGGTGPYQWYIYLDVDGKLVAALCSKAMGPTNYIEKKSTVVVTPKTWSHFVFTFDGTLITPASRINLIVDTIQVSTIASNVGSMGSTTQNTVQQLTIGGGHAAGNSNQVTNPFKGAIDDIRIHNRILNWSEIVYLFTEHSDSNLTVNINDGIDGYWPIDSNVLDYSGNNYNGTLMNNPAYIKDRANRNNGAIQFNGTTQYVRVGDVLDTLFCHKPNAVFSISGWLKFVDTPSTRQVLLSKAAGGSGPYQWYLYIDTDGKLVAAFCSTANGPTDYVEKKSPNLISTTNWTHFVFNFNGYALDRTNRIQLYSDTVVGELFTDVGNMQTSSENTDQEIIFGACHIAGNPTIPVNQFKGALDDIRIHNRNLNMKEISYLYHTISPYLGSGLKNIIDYPSSQIYPNPAKNYVTISFSSPIGKYNVAIYNLTGELVYKSDASSQNFNIDISSLNSGMYMLVIKNNESLFSHKLIKE